MSMASGARMAMKSYHPKSQALQVGAAATCVICLLAIRQNMGLDLESGGLALACLVALGMGGYLTSGKRVGVELAGGEVRTVWRLAGVPLRQTRQTFDAEGVELRPQWLRWLSVQGGSVQGIQKTLVYDLVLVGYGDQSQKAQDLVVELKEDQILYTLAERRARAVGEGLNLPVAVRWDRLFDDVPCEERERGRWRRPFAYPQQLKDWRKWVSW